MRCNRPRRVELKLHTSSPSKPHAIGPYPAAHNACMPDIQVRKHKQGEYSERTCGVASDATLCVAWCTRRSDLAQCGLSSNASLAESVSAM